MVEEEKLKLRRLDQVQEEQISKVDHVCETSVELELEEVLEQEEIQILAVRSTESGLSARMTAR